MIEKTIFHSKILEELHLKYIASVGKDSLEIVLKFENFSQIFLNIILKGAINEGYGRR